MVCIEIHNWEGKCRQVMIDTHYYFFILSSILSEKESKIESKNNETKYTLMWV